MTEPHRLLDPPQEVNTHKRRLAWAREVIQEEEKYGALDRTSRECKRPPTHSSYVALLCDIIDADPSSYEEVANKKGKESTNSRRMMSRMWYLQVPSCSRWKHHGIQGNINSMRLLTKGRNRL